MSWPLPKTPAGRLRLALGYPYEAPAGGFLLRSGSIHALEGADFDGRLAVLAHGSNRAPEQLARKFPLGEMPVTCGWLQDYTVVYAACLTRYGACPSLLHYRPGTAARVSLNWLTPEQLRVMHATEGAYAFGRLEADFEPDEGPRPAALHLYHGTAGCLALDGSAAALAAVERRACSLPSLTQRAVLSAIHTGQGGNHGLENFLLDMIDRAGRRAELSRRLALTALPNPLPRFRALAPAPDAG